MNESLNEYSVCIFGERDFGKQTHKGEINIFSYYRLLLDYIMNRHSISEFCPFLSYQYPIRCPLMHGGLLYLGRLARMAKWRLIGLKNRERSYRIPLL